MSDLQTLMLVGLMGGVLGLFFFGGLWWTVRRAIGARQPALWILGSLVLRTSVVLAGFYLGCGPHWDRLLTCLFGFVVARLVVVRLTRSAGEASHAP